MLNSLCYAQPLKWMIPAGVMLGVAPTVLTSWALWRIFTLLLPFRIYGKGDETAYALYQRLVLFFYINYTGVRIILYGEYEDMLERSENVIFISNHQSAVDWIIADVLAERQGSLGNIRYVLKDGLKYLPLYGFYLRQHSCIYVKRGNFQVGQAVKELQLLNRQKTPFWMVIFPEGTRYNPNLADIIRKSEQYAQEQGMDPLKHHLTPRTKAFQLCVNELRDVTDAVYDITAAYSGTYCQGQRIVAPGLADFLAGICGELHIHIKRIPISKVPSDPEKIKHFLYERFRQKDQLLERFYSSDVSVNGTLDDGGYKHRLGYRSTLPALLFWLAVHVPLFATHTGRQFYWKTTVFGMFAGWTWVTLK